jgi:hypothetical protein
MVDDSPEHTDQSPDAGRAKRPPPTIDLEATEVSAETPHVGADAEPERKSHEPTAAAISSWVIAAVSGAVAASLVIAVAWVLGWPAVVPATPIPPQVNTAAIDDLAARVASVESKAAKAPAAVPDPAAASRIEALEKSLSSLRNELATARAQSEKLAAAVNDVKAAPRESPPPVDLSAINERIAGLERATRGQGAEIVQESAKATDDVPLRRVVAAALLDVMVRSGEAYTAALAAAKSLAENADGLKPLEGYAATGVPGAATLSRELLSLVPKLSPPAPENSTTSTGIVDRLQAVAAKLIRIERTDGVGNDRGAVVARVTAAALRNDVAEARRELKTLAPADRAAAQSWIENADARDAALAASRQFATDAMAALARPRQ